MATSDGRKSRPRRLFSFESTKSSASSTSRYSADSELQGSKQLRPRASSKTAHLSDEHRRESTPPPLSPSESVTEPIRPIPADEPTRSLPRARWDSLRQHVLQRRPSTPPSAQSVVSPRSVQVQVPRAASPKPSRLARLGFRQLVDQVKDVLTDEAHKFRDEILRACVLARYPDTSKSTKDGVVYGSTATLTGSSTMASASTSGAKKMDYIRRPTSIASLSTLTTSNAPTLCHLYQILINHSGPGKLPQLDSGNLPHESQVLATLLCPFLTPAKYPPERLAEEQITAVETFELISTSWLSVNEAANVERCIWCTKSAARLAPSPTRTRILGSLWRLLVPGEKGRIPLTVHGFQSIANGLLMLLTALYRSSSSSPAISSSLSFQPANFQHPPHPDINLLQDLIPQFLEGSLGELEEDNVEEEYRAQFSETDRNNLAKVTQVVFLNSLVNCVENGAAEGEWLLCNVIEQYWPLPSSSSLTMLQAAACRRKLDTYCRFSLHLLHPFVLPSFSKSSSRPIFTSSSSSSLNAVDFDETRDTNVLTQIVSVLQSRIIREAESLDISTGLDTKIVTETRIHIVRVILELICLDSSRHAEAYSPGSDVFGATRTRVPVYSEILRGHVKWATDLLCEWYIAADDTPWKSVLDLALRRVITGGWSSSVPILSSLLKYIPDELKKPVFSSLVPILNDQLVENPPPYPYLQLSTFLTSLSKALPPVFYKPLFACAASDKEVIVVNHLCTIHVHSKYVGDYWVRDVEMMCMALLGDAGNKSASEWGNGRLGQLIPLIELIGEVRRWRHEKESAANTSDFKFVDIARFVTTLESRLWMMIEAQERMKNLPASQRMLLCILFREFRLITRTLRIAPWLSRTLSWFAVYHSDDLMDDLEKEVTYSSERIQGLYTAGQEGVQQNQKRHTSLLAASAAKASATSHHEEGKPLDLAATFIEHKELIDSLSKGYPPKALKLFVTMSALISNEDYLNIGPLIWRHCLDNFDSSYTASACFLFMQCSEKIPLDMQAVMEVDLQTSDDITRLEAVQKLGVLINSRFQILNQNFLTDRNHRPFKLARPPLPFIATDIGTSLYVHVENTNELKDTNDVPLELKRRLAELGWGDEDIKAVDLRQNWIKMPLSILPANQLERLEVGTSDLPFSAGVTSPLSIQSSPRKRKQQEDHSNVLRRNSSSGGHSGAVKRRAVFVPALTSIFPRLATMALDSNFEVASAARATLLDLMRNDPALLTRPIFDLLSGENKNIQLAVSTFAALLHVRKFLPPPLTHTIFNNLAGFLKTVTKHAETAESLHDFGLVLPILVNVATQVSGISIKEIRRSKLEPYVIPSGSLWFSASAPKGPMFPRSFTSSNNPFDPVPQSLISITMIRVSQNIFFLNMLKRNYQDVQVIRKNMSRLVLPSLDEQDLVKELEIYDFMPRKHVVDSRPSLKNKTVTALSLMISRSYILLVAQIFRSMPRHLSDRKELAILIDGLNRSLITHGDDINIVSQVLIALMVAGARFRRLFTAGGGYSLFMPALLKVYTESPSHPGIRGAIEYAVSRFYALHKESFLYQSINTIGQVAMLPELDLNWYSKGVYDVFSSLKKGAAPSTTDMAGIRNANKSEEREALIVQTANEKPQTFLASLRRVDTEEGRQLSFYLPDESESNNRLSMDNFVRLFLTIIAHDLSISRAQHFLRSLRILSPHLYNASASTRTVLSDGIVALGALLIRTFLKPNGPGENFLKQANRDADLSFLSPDPTVENGPKEKHMMPCDSKAMRFDYLLLVLSFGNSGGQVTLALAHQVFNIFKTLVKDADSNMEQLANFLGDFVKMSLIREHPPSPKVVAAFIKELSPILHDYIHVLNLNDVFAIFLELSQMPPFLNDATFGEVLVSEICGVGLAACDVAASENRLMTLPIRPILINLLAEAIFFEDVDIISELEKRPPTYAYLAGVILPLTISMETESQVFANGLRTEQHRRTLAIGWLRILYYVIDACQNSRKDEDGIRSPFSIRGSFRSKTSDKRRLDEGAFWRSHLPTFMTALQVIKVIVVRGAEDIASIPKVGIWERLAGFLKTMLAEGNAEFASRPELSSTLTTPTGSPSASVQYDLSNSGSGLFVSTSSGLSRASSPERRQVLCRPRIVDYSLWSMLEFVCSYRSPLRMQLKLLMMEKVAVLDHELQSHRSPNSSRNLSPFSATPMSGVSSAFSKARQLHHASLTVPSPDSSPRISPSSSNLTPSPSLLEIPGRRPGYQMSPVSPHEQSNPFMPKIIHLGPASPSAFGGPKASPAIGPKAKHKMGDFFGDDGVVFDASSPASSTPRSTKINSINLIQETYRRIRVVQTFMGYNLLLPIPGRDSDEEGGTVKVEIWNRHQALSLIVKETNDLLEEFEDSSGIGDDSLIIEPLRLSMSSSSAS